MTRLASRSSTSSDVDDGSRASEYRARRSATCSSAIVRLTQGRRSLGAWIDVRSARSSSSRRSIEPARRRLDLPRFSVRDRRAHRSRSIERDAAVERARPRHVRSGPIAVPPPRARRARSSDCVAPMLRSSRLSLEQPSVSQPIRDLLLPKLVTGAIDVSKLDLDALLEEPAA